MQLLYGNDGKNYRILAKSAALTVSQAQALIRNYQIYTQTGQRALYSGAEKEPVAYSYVTTNLSDTLDREMIMVGMNGKLSTFETPSNFAHFYLNEIQEDSYRERFMDIFRTEFIRPEQCALFSGRNIDSFHPEGKRRVDLHAIPEEKLVTLLARLLWAADMASGQVRILCDKEGDAYNQRALDIIATIYQYLPYGIRKSVGFTSYAVPSDPVPGRIKLIVMTKDSKKGCGDYVDLEQMDPFMLNAKLPEKTVAFASAIVAETEEKRKLLFDELDSVLGKENGSAERYVNFYVNRKNWKSKSLEAVADEIVIHVVKLRDSGTEESRIYREIAADKFTDQFYQKRLKKLLETEKKDGIASFSREMTCYLAFADLIPSLKPDEEMFLEWHSAVLEKLHHENADRNAYRCALEKLLECSGKFASAGEKTNALKERILLQIRDAVRSAGLELEQARQLEAADAERGRRAMKRFVWIDRHDILLSYAEAAQRLAEMEKEGEILPECQVMIGDLSVRLSMRQLKELASYVLVQDEESREAADELMERNEGLYVALKEELLLAENLYGTAGEGTGSRADAGKAATTACKGADSGPKSGSKGVAGFPVLTFISSMIFAAAFLLSALCYRYMGSRILLTFLFSAAFLVLAAIVLTTGRRLKKRKERAVMAAVGIGLGISAVMVWLARLLTG